MELDISEYFKSAVVNDLYFYFVYQSRFIAMKKFLLRNQVKNMVITGEYGPDAICLSLACKEANTRCLWYQHTPYTPDKFWIRVSSKFAKLHKGLDCSFPFPDRVLVWSEMYKQYLEKYTHTPESKISIVENLQYYSVRIEKQKEIKRKYKLVFLPAVIKEEVFLFLSFANHLVETGFCQANEIFFKLHPDSNYYYDFKEMQMQYSFLEEIEFSMDILATSVLCALSEHYVVGSSQMGLELMLYGASFSQYEPSIGVNFSPFYDSENVKSFSKIEELLEDLSNPNRKMLNFIDGFYMFPTENLQYFSQALTT